MKWLVISATAWLLGSVTAQGPPIGLCSTCYTSTSTVPINCPPFNPATCVSPSCTKTVTTVIPTKSCKSVVTSIRSCQTTCTTGCRTTTTTIVDKTDSCVPTSPSKCFTATTTSGTINCPLDPSCKTTTTTTSTVTRPVKNPYCTTTPTVTARPTCATSCKSTVTTTITAKPA